MLLKATILLCTLLFCVVLTGCQQAASLPPVAETDASQNAAEEENSSPETTEELEDKNEDLLKQMYDDAGNGQLNGQSLASDTSMSTVEQQLGNGTLDETSDYTILSFTDKHITYYFDKSSEKATMISSMQPELKDLSIEAVVETLGPSSDKLPVPGDTYVFRQIYTLDDYTLSFVYNAEDGIIRAVELSKHSKA